MDEARNYEVGYGKPPTHSRFKKGTSGNPKGRRPKSSNVDKLMDEELDRKITVHENGKSARITLRQFIIKRHIRNAMEGDARAINHVLEFMRTRSKPDPFDLEPADEEALKVFIENRAHTEEK